MSQAEKQSLERSLEQAQRTIRTKEQQIIQLKVGDTGIYIVILGYRDNDIYRDTGIYTGPEDHQDQGAADHPAQGGGDRDLYRDTGIYI